MQLITGALPAEYGLRTAGIVDIQTKSGIFQPGGSVEMRGGSYGTVQPSARYGGSIAGYNYYVSARQSRDRTTASTRSPPKYNQIHDDTNQTHAFAYLDKIIDTASKIAFVGGTFQGQFQIPNNPGQTPPSGHRRDFNARRSPASRITIRAPSPSIRSRPTISASCPICAAEEDFDFQVSAFSKYSTLHFHPDSLGDIFFNGVAQDALRQSFANGVQADGSYRLGADHTLRAGMYLQAEKASADTNSSVLPITACNVGRRFDRRRLSRFGRGDLWHDAESIIQDQAKTGWTLQRLSPGRVEDPAERHHQLWRPVRRRERVHDGEPDQPAPQRGLEAD